MTARRVLGTIAAVALVVLALAATWWLRRFRTYTPAAAILDLQAAARVQDAPRPVERFLELRYGPLTEPGNRQQALKDFFDVGHIEGLYLIAGYLPPAKKRDRIDATSRWIASYRETMSPQEQAELQQYFASDAGRARIRAATVQYLKKDARFRAETAVVIEELMLTLDAIQRQGATR